MDHIIYTPALEKVIDLRVIRREVLGEIQVNFQTIAISQTHIQLWLVCCVTNVFSI